MARTVTALASMAAILFAIGEFSSAAPLNAKPVRTSKAACERVKTRISAVEHFPVSSVAFCDTIGTADSPRGFYVLAPQQPALQWNMRKRGL